MRIGMVLARGTDNRSRPLARAAREFEARSPGAETTRSARWRLARGCWNRPRRRRGPRQHPPARDPRLPGGQAGRARLASPAVVHGPLVAEPWVIADIGSDLVEGGFAATHLSPARGIEAKVPGAGAGIDLGDLRALGPAESAAPVQLVEDVLRQ